MSRVEVTAATFPGKALKGSGSDTLVLKGGGIFDFAYVTLSGFSEILIEGGPQVRTTIRISGQQLTDIASIAYADGSTLFRSTSVYLTGSTIDLSDKNLDQVSAISIADDNATVTVNSLLLALKLNALECQGETIVLKDLVTTPTSRTGLHDHGFDTIVETTDEGPMTWTNAAPVLTGLGGRFHVKEGASVRLDPDHNAAISDADGRIVYLDIVLSGSGYYFPMKHFRFSPDFTILDGSFDQTLLYKGSSIGWIGDIAYGEGARITFSPSATPEIINAFVQSLAYTPGDFVHYQNVTIKVTARDQGQRKSEAVLYVTAEPNWTPTKPTLKGNLVREDAAAGTVVGTLSATDANGDRVSYKLTNSAGGRFSIENNKLVVSGKVPLDFEGASKHTVTVVATDGKKNGQPATFTISVKDVAENLSSTSKGDKLFGTGGNNTLNGRLGNDVLTGSGGKDAFVFNTKLGPSNIDRITDFLPGQDIIRLESAIFTKIGKVGTLKAQAFYEGTKAHDKDDRIIYNKKTGALYYDPDGTGASKAVHFATLSNKPDLKYSDLYVI